MANSKEINSNFLKKILKKSFLYFGYEVKRKNNFIDRYGDYILLNPPFKVNTLVLWLLPFIFCIIGLFIIIINNKKSKKI